MSIIDGTGILQCFRHNFETRDVEEWNKHCDDGDHFEVGSTHCNKCGAFIEFEDLPYHPFDAKGSKNISLTCDECNTKLRGQVKLTKRSAETQAEPSGSGGGAGIGEQQQAEPKKKVTGVARK